jgi:DNA-binding transcriptional MerR regulator
MDKMKLQLRISQVASALGLSEHQVRIMIKRGDLQTLGKNRKTVLLDDLLKLEPNVSQTLLITTGQVASLLGVLPQAVRGMADCGFITATQSAQVEGRHRRYRFCEVVEIKVKRERARKNGDGNSNG